MRYLLYILLLIFFDNIPQKIDLINIPDINGKNISLKHIKKNKLTVFVFVSPECPLCKNYASELNSINNKYHDKNVQFFGVFSGKFYTNKQYQEYAKIYKINFTLINDEKKNLSKLFGAKVTPEVVVLDNKQFVRYKGQIDNWAYEIGKKRKIVTEHNLTDALDALLSGNKINKPQTHAVGCLIE